MRQVKDQGNYKLDPYYIQEPDGGDREIRHANMARVSSVEVLQVKPNEPDRETDDSSMDQETKDELELAEALSGSGDKGIFREVMRQATRVMPVQFPASDTEDSEAEELGNGYDL
jgi:hypothetical protein